MTIHRRYVFQLTTGTSFNMEFISEKNFAGATLISVNAGTDRSATYPDHEKLGVSACASVNEILF